VIQAFVLGWFSICNGLVFGLNVYVRFCLWNNMFFFLSIGFYRVNYDLNNWQQLIKQLNESNTNIHVLNRVQLIDDSFNLARAGMLNYTIPLNLSTYLTKEDDQIPWYTAIECLSYVVERMRRSAQGYDYIKVCKEIYII
jgi:aminopeptidase N